MRTRIQSYILPAQPVMMDTVRFDIIFDMDCLYYHYVTIDCRGKKLYIEVPSDKITFKVRMPDGTGKMLVSLINAKSYVESGVQLIWCR